MGQDLVDLLQGLPVELTGEGAYGFQDGVYHVRAGTRAYGLTNRNGYFRCTRQTWVNRPDTVSILPGQVVRLWLR
jgi:hypothetical protein